MIDSYSFGSMVIDGRRYTSDLIIYPDGRVQDSWWREKGHRLSLSDIADLIAEKPALIIVGTGSSGMMEPDQDVPDALAQQGIQFEALPTRQAVERYNHLSRARRTGACFHLTC